MSRAITGPIDVSSVGEYRLSDFISALPQSMSVDPIKFGAVYRNRDRLYTDIDLQARDCVRIHFDPRRFPAQLNWSERVIYEDEQMLAIDKPAGVPSHPTCDNAIENVLFQLRAIYGEILLVHRLDIDTSGLMVFARNPNRHQFLNEMFASRNVQKCYRALVSKPIELGKYVHFLEESNRAPRVMHPQEVANSKRCEMNVLSCLAHRNGYLIEMEAVTGRNHQLRAQLAALGNPIVGDTLYGSMENHPQGIALQSFSLSFQLFTESVHWVLAPAW